MESTDGTCSGMFKYHELYKGELFADHNKRGTFFPGLEGFTEIQNPDIEMFRMYGTFSAADFKRHKLNQLSTQSQTSPPSQKAATSPARPSSAPAK